MKSITRQQTLELFKQHKKLVLIPIIGLYIWVLISIAVVRPLYHWELLGNLFIPRASFTQFITVLLTALLILYFGKFIMTLMQAILCITITQYHHAPLIQTSTRHSWIIKRALSWLSYHMIGIKALRYKIDHWRYPMLRSDQTLATTTDNNNTQTKDHVLPRRTQLLHFVTFMLQPLSFQHAQHTSQQLFVRTWGKHGKPIAAVTRIFPVVYLIAASPLLSLLFTQHKAMTTLTFIISGLLLLIAQSLVITLRAIAVVLAYGLTAQSNDHS